MIDPDGTFDLGLTFNPNRIGLQPGEIQIVSDDPETPTLRLAVVGTGLADTGTALDYGKDFVAVETPLVPGSLVLRQVSDSKGNWQFVLPPQESIHYAIFDPESGLIAHGFDVTAASGEPTPISAPEFLASTERDSDGDGLPDDVEFTLGTSSTKADTDGDGLSDFVEIAQGLDPLGGRAFPTGIIANLRLQGEARDLVVEGLPGGKAGQIAYVAAGSGGLAIVDASQFSKPILLSRLGLPVMPRT